MWKPKRMEEMSWLTFETIRNFVPVRARKKMQNGGKKRTTKIKKNSE